MRTIRYILLPLGLTLTAGIAQAQRTTLPPEPVVTGVGLEPVPWRTPAEDAEQRLAPLGFTRAADGTEIVGTRVVLGRPATVRYQLSRWRLLHSISVDWAPRSASDAVAWFNAFLAPLDAATGQPHRSSTSLPLTALPTTVVPTMAHWGRRDEGMVGLMLRRDSSLTLSIAPRDRSLFWADAVDYRALVLAFPVVASAEGMRQVWVNARACPRDVPPLTTLAGRAIQLDVGADGATQVSAQDESSGPADEVRRLNAWLATCPIAPASSDRARAASRVWFTVPRPNPYG